MTLHDQNNELIGDVPLTEWKEECVFCPKAWNCGSVISDTCPLDETGEL